MFGWLRKRWPCYTEYWPKGWKTPLMVRCDEWEAYWRIDCEEFERNCDRGYRSECV